MPKFVRLAQPPLAYIPTAYNPWVMRAIHWALPFFLRVRVRPWLPAGISHIEVENVDRLVDLYAQFEAGKTRFLMSVRHVEVDDPMIGLYLCSRAVAKAAKARGIKLMQPVQTHFVYERGMTIWAGDGIGWLLSRIGGTPVRRGRKPDWVGLKAARKLLLEGSMPMVVAPEGATNGHSERIGPLEPGVAQMGFWCAEDLQREQRGESVFILPMGLQYYYVEPDWAKLQRVLGDLERQSGSKEVSVLAQTADKDCFLRILRLGEHLLATLETFYSRWYGYECDKSSDNNATPPEKKEDCSGRLTHLLDHALGVAEQFFKLPRKGNLVDRCRRLEEASWNCIYREDLPKLDTLSPLERGLADWVAQESSLRELHMRVVETFVAVDDLYLKEKPSFERCAEMTLLMSDLLGRLGGDKLPSRPRLGNRRVKLTVQPPIEITPRLVEYQQNRRTGRKVVAAVTEEIRQSLEETIER